MRQNKRRALFSWLGLLVFLLACGLPSRSSEQVAAEPQSLDALNTAIVETSAAAQTQTATVQPTATRTPTATFTPTNTHTPTPTFIFLLPTFTPNFTATPLGPISLGPLSNATSGTPEKSIYTDHPWSCRVIGRQPDDGVVYKPGTRFYVSWTLLNTGNETWTVNGVDFIFSAGYQNEDHIVQDFRVNVPRGGKVTVTATFVAPKTPGEYNSFFSLMVGSREFCGMRTIFEVRK